jgi:peptidoglycan/LPS O-acetylase OafA/YrhL
VGPGPVGALTAHRRGWLDRFDARTGWLWLTGGLLGVVLLFAVGADVPCFGTGGLNGPAALWAAYDSTLCVALSIGLLTLFRETVTGSGHLTRELAAGSYAVYTVHLPLVVMLQYHLADRDLDAAALWAAVSAVSIPTAFLLAAVLRRLPGFRRVL